MSIGSSRNFVKRERMWIRRTTIQQIVQLLEEDDARFAALFLVTYIFLLRLPSEALPITCGKDTSSHCLFLEDESLVLTLSRRKNRPQGSRLTRGCWCSESAITCPVHAIGRVIEEVEPGTALFEGITSTAALTKLRETLQIAGVAKAGLYRCHDIRRGHAVDLQMSGAPLHTILAAGDWRSPAFLDYLDLHGLERDLVVQAHMDESEEELEA